jgi:hypothetical protein
MKKKEKEKDLLGRFQHTRPNPTSRVQPSHAYGAPPHANTTGPSSAASHLTLAT